MRDVSNFPLIVADELWARVELLLPWPERSPGRGWRRYRICLQGIHFVLHRHSLTTPASGIGVRLRPDLLAPPGPGAESMETTPGIVTRQSRWSSRPRHRGLKLSPRILVRRETSAAGPAPLNVRRAASIPCSGPAGSVLESAVIRCQVKVPKGFQFGGGEGVQLPLLEIAVLAMGLPHLVGSHKHRMCQGGARTCGRPHEGALPVRRVEAGRHVREATDRDTHEVQS